MTNAISWLGEIENANAQARKSVGGPQQYLGAFPGPELGVNDRHQREYLTAGKALRRDRAQGLQAIEALANRGSPLSMLFLADAMRRGDYYQADLGKSEGWYKHAAALGSGRALYGLGLVYLATDEDGRAIEALETAGERGCGAAMWALGLLYKQGRASVTADIDAARAFFERGASLGHVWSSRSLALLLMSGRYGLGARIRGYARYLACFVVAPVAILRGQVDRIMG